MRLFTRRSVLTLAGAAGAVPFVAASARGFPPTSVAKDADVTINDGLVVRNLKDGTPLVSGTPVSLTYFKDTTAATYYCRLPWAEHLALAGPLIGGGMDLPAHKFTFDQIVTNKATAPVADNNKPHHVRITVDTGARPVSCCFMCGDTEICIPSGHSFLCNGIQFTCK